jgi:hypothetical protein
VSEGFDYHVPDGLVDLEVLWAEAATCFSEEMLKLWKLESCPRCDEPFEPTRAKRYVGGQWVHYNVESVRRRREMRAVGAGAKVSLVGGT